MPIKVEGCKKLLALLKEASHELRRVAQLIKAEEEQLNDLIYGLYKVSASERKVIEGFLGRYSSQPNSSLSVGVDSEQEDPATKE